MVFFVHIFGTDRSLICYALHFPHIVWRCSSWTSLVSAASLISVYSRQLDSRKGLETELVLCKVDINMIM